MKNRNRKSRVKSRESRARRSRRSRDVSARSSRRGVLLLVVLSMLVLFMLVGTAFLMSSNQSRHQMKEAAKQDRLGNYATKLLERAMFQIVRDTDNQASVIRYHSLLRDMYGTDGLQGVIYVPINTTSVPEKDFVTRFADAVYDPGDPSKLYGPTNGQFIDIYVARRDTQPSTRAGRRSITEANTTRQRIRWI